LMTASVRFKRKKAPIKTRGIKNKKVNGDTVAHVAAMFEVHPSSVTLVNVVTKAKNMVSKFS